MDKKEQLQVDAKKGKELFDQKATEFRQEREKLEKEFAELTAKMNGLQVSICEVDEGPKCALPIAKNNQGRGAL